MVGLYQIICLTNGLHARSVVYIEPQSLMDINKYSQVIPDASDYCNLQGSLFQTFISANNTAIEKGIITAFKEKVNSLSFVYQNYFFGSVNPNESFSSVNYFGATFYMGFALTIISLFALMTFVQYKFCLKNKIFKFLIFGNLLYILILFASFIFYSNIQLLFTYDFLISKVVICYNNLFKTLALVVLLSTFLYTILMVIFYILFKAFAKSENSMSITINTYFNPIYEEITEN